MLADNIRTPTMSRFIDFCHKHTKNVASSQLTDARTDMRRVRGMYDDTDGFVDNVRIAKKAIMGDALNYVLQDEQTQKIDLALKKIMKNGDGDGDGSKKLESAGTDDVDDDDYDGNEWDD
jgi:hypothetical protein